MIIQIYMVGESGEEKGMFIIPYLIEKHLFGLNSHDRHILEILYIWFQTAAMKQVVILLLVDVLVFNL